MSVQAARAVPARVSVRARRAAMVGIEGERMGLAQFQLGPSSPSMLVLGGPRSGKTNALRTMLLSLARRYTPDQPGLVLVDPRNAGLRDLCELPHVEVFAGTEAELAVAAEQINMRLEASDGRRRWVVCIDDYELGASLMSAQFTKPYNPTAAKNFAVVLESLLSLGRDRNWNVIAGANLPVLPSSPLSLINAGRSGIILRSHEYPVGTALLGTRLPIKRPGGVPPTGRAIMVVDGVEQVVQIALADAQIDGGGDASVNGSHDSLHGALA